MIESSVVCVYLYTYTHVYILHRIQCMCWWHTFSITVYIFCALVLYTLFLFPPTVQSLVLHPYLFWPPTRIVAIIRELKCNEDTSSLSCVSKRYSCSNVYQLLYDTNVCMFTIYWQAKWYAAFILTIVRLSDKVYNK